MEINKIYQGDTFSVLKSWPDEFIDLVITSPPYFGLRNYGVDGQIGLENSFDDFLEKILSITAEVKRVLKPSGQFWLNMGDCYGGSGGAHKNEVNRGISNSFIRAGFDKRNYGGLEEKRRDTMKLGRGRRGGDASKCLLMQPERLAIKMIDSQGWILRNKIKWCKQVLIKKQNKTIGSVMPSSVKDRFNESGEELYFFVKNKKYYSDLDAVRMKPQTFENRPNGIDREKDYPNAKRNKFAFNYRVRDIFRKGDIFVLRDDLTIKEKENILKECYEYQKQGM